MTEEVWLLLEFEKLMAQRTMAKPQKATEVTRAFETPIMLVVTSGRKREDMTGKKAHVEAK